MKLRGRKTSIIKKHLLLKYWCVDNINLISQTLSEKRFHNSMVANAKIQLSKTL